jgi:aerobic-type carbon monoxide dehydrogenase small subunit (CoxS/CutS family)
MQNKKMVYPCPYCAENFASFAALKNHVITGHKSEPLPAPEGEIKLTINDQPYQIRVEPDWTLQHLIHDVLGFTGTKLFCNNGACGACTVIMDKSPVLSCMTLAIDCNGSVIETVEGVAARQHPLIEAYVKNHAMQCGYCTPGFVMTAKALLDENPNPSEKDVREALAGNLCRCGTYPQHPKAVLEAAGKLAENEGQETKEHE